MAASLPYEEPNVVTILTYSSFLLLLVSINYVVDKVLFCGLVGQILIGVLFGAPGAQWLSTSFQHVVEELGYLGLILIVYEGGLATSFSTLRANLSLSSCVALTGIAAPIGLSFVLTKLADTTPLQSFAAGAALCSTSLGTTFAVLNASGLATTRLGVVLSTAAMLDDVVGLVMVQVISNLGGAAQSFDALTVIRPVFVSLGFAVIVPLICWAFRKSIVRLMTSIRSKHSQSLMVRLSSDAKFIFCLHTLYLLGMVTAASYAGTSNLFAAYIAGASVTWWDAELLHASSNTQQGEIKANKTIHRQEIEHTSLRAEVSKENTEDHLSETSGLAVFGKYYQPALITILKPFFFASIGFSIPITRMFASSIVWRGIIYALLMTFGKLLCGLWLVRLHIPRTNVTTPSLSSLRTLLSKLNIACWLPRRKDVAGKGTKTMINRPFRRGDEEIELQNKEDNSPADSDSTSETRPRVPSTHASAIPDLRPSLPRTIYPSLILGSAMTARGEIGFLISSLAESSGVFQSQSEPTGSTPPDSQAESEIFLIITWAIMLCTIIGPLTTGLLVRRVRRMEMGKEGGGGGSRDVLGVWGVS